MDFPKRIIIPFFLGVLGTVAGPIMAAPVLTHLVSMLFKTAKNPDGKDPTGLLAVCTFVVLLGAAWEVGQSMAKRHIKDRSLSAKRFTGFGLFITLWILLCFGMAALRACEAFITKTKYDKADGGDVVVAILLLIFDLVGGLCVISAVYVYLTSTYHLVRPTQKRAEKRAKQLDKAAGLAIHVAEALDANRLAAGQWAADYKAHCTRLANDSARIKDAVRLEFARSLGSPASTSAVFAPHKGTNVDEFEAEAP
jgi:hypothetical protein